MSDSHDEAERLFQIGIRLHQEDRLDEAIAVFQQAIAFDSHLADAYLWLGDAFMHQDKFLEARQVFTELASVHPDYAARGRALRGHASLNLGEFAQGERDFAEALKIDGHCDCAMYGLARLLAAFEKYQHALAYVLRAIQIDSEKAYRDLLRRVLREMEWDERDFLQTYIEIVNFGEETKKLAKLPAHRRN